MVLSLLAAGIGLVALLGWILRLPQLTNFGTDLIPMAPSSAVLLLLYGIAIFLWVRMPLRRRSFWVGVVVGYGGLTVTLLLLVLACLDIHWSVEHLGMDAGKTASGVVLGHMSAVTAFCFILVSLSFLFSLLPWSKGFWRTALASGLSGLLLGISFVFLLAYLYGMPLLYGGKFIPPALNVLLAFMLLSLALLILAWPSTSSPPGGQSAAFPKTAFLLLLIFFILALGIITTGFLYYRQYERNYREEVEGQLSAVAELKVGELTQWRKERLGDGAILFRNAAFSSLVKRCFEKPEDAEAFRQLQAWMGKYTDKYDQIRVLDTQGVSRVVVPQPRAAMASVILQYLPDVLRSQQVTLQDFYKNEHDQRVYLAVLVPLFDEADNGRPLGALVMRIDPGTHLYPYIKYWPTPSRTAETLLVRREGHEALFLNELRFETNTALTLRVPLDHITRTAAQAALGREGIMVGTDYRRVSVVAALRTIPDSPWSLVARMDTAEVYAPIRQRLWQVVVMMGILLFGAGACIGLVWRNQYICGYRERAEVAESLRNSEVRFRRLFEAARDGVLILDAETGKILDVNPFLMEMLGYSHAEFLGRSIWELGFFKDIVASQSSFSELQQKEYIRYDDKPLAAADGRRIDVEFISNVYLVNDRKVIQCNIRDITERKQAAESFRQSEGRFRCLLQSVSSVAVQSYGPDGVARYWNQASEQIYGYTAQEAIGRNLLDLIIPAEMREAVKQAMQQMAQTGQPIPASELSLQRKDGSRVSVFSSHAIVQMPGSEPELFCIDVDLTERKRMEESRARLATAVEQATETIVITDPKGTIVYVNPAFEKTTGYTCEEAIGQNPRILKSGKHDAEFYRQMWEVLCAGKVWSGRIINKRKDGTLYEEDANLSPVIDEAGMIVNYVGVKRDVTREALLEQQLLQAQKLEAIGRLAGGVAHDFNNILAVILMHASELNEDTAITLVQSDGLNEIVMAAERGANLTRQLLAFSRRQVMQLRSLDLNDVVAGVAKMLQRLIGENIELHTRLAPGDVQVWGDAGMIEQVLLNLVVNARDAMPDGGQLFIELDRIVADEVPDVRHKGQAGDFVRLTVRDTGYGIAPEHLPHIFEPFYTTKAAGKGTGLGLSTLHGIVEQHHGWVEVESQLGQGTVIHIYLPRLLEVKPVKSEHQAVALVGGGHETILLVEDEPSLRMLAVRVLNHYGYRVFEAANGMAALEVWRQHHSEIDLLLTDIIMPEGLSGGKLADQLLAEKAGLKVIYMSGYSGQETGNTLNLREGRKFLQKPFLPIKLVQTVRDCLDKT